MHATAKIPIPPGLVLWTGPKHSGKTTALERLVERARSEGRSVAGILAPSVWRQGQLVGFDVLNSATGRRVPLAARAGRADPGAETAGQFAFDRSGQDFGRAALTDPKVKTASLVIVDEFGPLELDGGGWRAQVDGLVEEATGLVVLVVRRDLAKTVSDLYGIPADHVIDASNGQRATEAVMGLLRSR